MGSLQPEPPDPAWNGWDVVRLTILIVVALFASILGAVFIAHRVLYPDASLSQVAMMPLVSVAGQAFGYLVVLGYMYVLVTRERGRSDFLNAIHWNWPSIAALYLLVGVVLSVVLQLLADRLPVPRNLPIDKFFQTPAEAWVVTICGVTLFPLMEELFFRGFLYPVVKRRLGLIAAVILTAFAFALLHGAQLRFAWAPVLVIFLVGLALTMVRAWRNSVGAGLLVHIGYNGIISAAMFINTGGFRHLEKLSSQ
jgi:membrane protease YdiL (CAAX protease family)